MLLIIFFIGTIIRECKSLKDMNPDQFKKPKKSSSENLPLRDKKAPMGDEVNSMLKRILDIKADLENQLNNIYAKAEVKRIDIKKYLDNPKNFSATEWNKVQKDKDSLVEQIVLLFTPETQIQKVAKSKEKLTKERKGKTLGSRRNWIPMK